jgi:hypothetical protein
MGAIEKPDTLAISAKPISVDLYTAGQPAMLASALVIAAERGRQLAINDFDLMNLTLMLQGIVYESSSDAYYNVEQWLEDGLRDLRPLIGDRLTLDNALSSVALLEGAQRVGLAIVTSSADLYLDAHLYLSRGFLAAGLPVRVGEKAFQAYIKRVGSYGRIPVGGRFVSSFKDPTMWSSNVSDSFMRCLGAAIRGDTDLLTAQKRYYKALRQELLVPLRLQKLTRTSLFGGAVGADPRQTTVKDVFTVLERHEEWATLLKLHERIESKRSASELMVYGIEEIVGTFGRPFVWLVKLGAFLAKKLT